MSRVLFLPNILINHLTIPEKSNMLEEIVLGKKENITFMFNQNSKSNFACWNCALLFQNESWTIPIIYTNIIVESKKKPYNPSLNLLDSQNRVEEKTLYSIGNFCSLACSYRFLLESSDISPNRKKTYEKLLIYYCKERLGIFPQVLPCAYPRYKMKFYGGDWTEEEYINQNKLLEKNFLNI